MSFSTQYKTVLTNITIAMYISYTFDDVIILDIQLIELSIMYRIFLNFNNG